MNLVAIYYYKFRLMAPAEHVAVMLGSFVLFILSFYAMKNLFWPSEMEGDRKRRLISTTLVALVIAGVVGYFGWRGYGRVVKAEAVLLLPRAERFERAEGSLVTVGAVDRDESGNLVGVEPIVTHSADQWRQLWRLMEAESGLR